MTIYILRDKFAEMPPLRRHTGGNTGRESRGGHKPVLTTFKGWPLGHNRQLKGAYRRYTPR